MLTPICSLFGMPMHHHEFSVLRFCEELHMVANGSGNYGNEAIMMREYLRAKILNWQPSTHAFDSIVKDLIVQTLKECDESGIFDSLEVAKKTFDVDPSYWKEQLDKLRR